MTLQIPSIASSAPTLTAVQRRLLLICTAMGVGGGAEEQVMRLAMAFQSRGWKTMIVSLLPPSTIMPAEFTSQGIELVDLGMRKALPDPRGLLRLAKVVRDFRPDVVHSHMVHANLIARAVRAIAPVPVLVCTHHNLTMAGVRNDHSAVFEFAHRITDGFAERTTAICHAAVDYCIEHRVAPASKMMVVPNGIDCERFAHNPEARKRLREQLGINDDFVWLAVGRLVLQKAYPTMLRAFAKLAPVGQTLLICGQGILREELIALAAELGIAERVRFLGLRRVCPFLRYGRPSAGPPASLGSGASDCRDKRFGKSGSSERGCERLPDSAGSARSLCPGHGADGCAACRRSCRHGQSRAGARAEKL
jgi:glycosyltransferase involved in cell wall biosynthesis